MAMPQAAAQGRAAAGRNGWAGLFASAFQKSRNPMVLLDERRVQVDANGAYRKLLDYRRDRILGFPVHEFVAGGPVASADEWAAALGSERFTGQVDLIARDGTVLAVQRRASTEDVAGAKLCSWRR